MIHFEDIWNDAELTAAHDEERSLESIVQAIHSRAEQIKDYINNPKKQALNIGELLFEVASAVNLAERTNKTPINIAAGLKLITEKRKEDLFDPEINE